jgi:hypothetical protein
MLQESVSLKTVKLSVLWNIAFGHHFVPEVHHFLTFKQLQHYNTLKIQTVLTWMKELLSPLNSTICSVSTKLATLPSTSMPLVKRRVPARKQQRRDTIVHKNGLPFSEHWFIEITGLASLRKLNRLWTHSPTQLPAEK